MIFFKNINAGEKKDLHPNAYFLVYNNLMVRRDRWCANCFEWITRDHQSLQNFSQKITCKWTENKENRTMENYHHVAYDLRISNLFITVTLLCKCVSPCYVSPYT